MTSSFRCREGEKLDGDNHRSKLDDDYASKLVRNVETNSRTDSAVVQ